MEQYTNVEMEVIRFEMSDIATNNSYELPFLPAIEDGSADH